MTNRRELLGGALAALSQSLAARGQVRSGAGRKVVLEHDLPRLELDNWAVTAVEVSYAAGAGSPSHRHPGFAVVYVLEGEVASQVEGQPEKTYSAGEMFYEPPGHIHVVSRNASDTKPARFLALLFAEKGKPLTTPA